MRLKKRFQQLEKRLERLEKTLAKRPTKTRKTKRVVRENCKICGNPLPTRKWVYCSVACAKEGHRAACLKYIRKLKKKKLPKGRKGWSPTKKEMDMFRDGKLSAAQWKKHFGVKTYTGVYKKLGQLAMHIQDQ